MAGPASAIKGEAENRIKMEYSRVLLIGGKVLTVTVRDNEMGLLSGGSSRDRDRQFGETCCTEPHK